MTSNTKQQPLFTPVRMGNLELRNRIVMAPLTRMRAKQSRTCAYRTPRGVLCAARFCWPHYRGMH